MQTFISRERNGRARPIAVGAAIFAVLLLAWRLTAAELDSISVGPQSPAQVSQGAAAAFKIALPRGSTNGTFRARLSVSGLPSGAAGTFVQNPVVVTGNSSGTGDLTVTTSATTPIGSQAFTVRAELVDQQDNPVSPAITRTASGTLQVIASDGVKPTAAAQLSSGGIIVDAAGWHNTNIMVGVTGQDNAGGSGVKEILYSASGAQTIPATLIPGLSASVEITAEGTTTVTYQARDNAGNISDPKTIQVKIDKTAPAISGADVVDSAWRNTPITQTFTAADSGGSGLAVPSDASFTLTASADSTLSGSTVVPTTASKTVMDLAGNASTRSISTLIDTKKPEIRSATPTGITGNAPWYRSDVAVQIAIDDSLSGLLNPGEDMSFELTTTGEGQAVKTGSRVVKDKAGNSITVGEYTYSVDKTPPSVSPDDVVNTTWRNTDLSQNFTATDFVSGLADGAQATFVLSASQESAGASTPTVVSVTVADKAGNSRTRSVSALIDKTAPEVVLANVSGLEGNLISGTPSIQWYRSDVTVSYTATDALSGLQSPADASTSLTTTGEGVAVSTGSKEIVDVAGNRATAGPRTFAVDKTPPVVTATANRPPDVVNNFGSWFTGPIRFNIQAQDNASGVASCPAFVDYSGPDGLNSRITADYSDRAGNSVQGGVLAEFKYDATAPALDITHVAEGDYVQSTLLGVNAFDVLLADIAARLTRTYNGVTSAQDVANPLVTFPINLPGKYVYSATARDQAGHATTRTVHFTVDQQAPSILVGDGFPLDGGFYNTDLTLRYWLEDDLDPNPTVTLQQLLSELVMGNADPLPILSPHTVMASEVGRHTVRIEGEDHAGNKTSAARTFTIDTESPETGATLSGTAGAAGWFRSPVSVSLNSVDPLIRPSDLARALPEIPGSGVVGLAFSATGAQQVPPTLVGGGSTHYDVSTEGITTIQFRAKDRAGNEEEIRTAVIRYDKTPPQVTVPMDLQVEATGPSGAPVTFASPTVHDNVDAQPVVTVTADGKPVQPGDAFPLGSTLVLATATDAAGNEATGSFTITVVDTTKPDFRDLPKDITIEATGPDGAAVEFTPPTAVDTVDGPVKVVATHASGSTFGLGETVVTFTAVDKAGNTAQADLKIKVQDTTPPAIGTLADVVAEARSAAGAEVQYDVPTATDLVDREVQVTSTPTSGSTFPLGDTTVTVTARDDAGNQSQKTFKVSVRDTTPPEIRGAQEDDLELEATGPLGAVATFAMPTASDLVDGDVIVVSSNRSGDTFPLGSTIEVNP